MFQTLLFQPLYNALVWIVSVIPGANLGVAVILLTIFVKGLLYPLSKKSIHSQILQKEMQPKIKALREKYPDQKEQSVKMMELYKESGTNPFSGCLVILIQLPIILALFMVFQRGIDFNPELLYSFVSLPEVFSKTFLTIDLESLTTFKELFSGVISYKNILLGLVTGIIQYVQMSLSPAFADNNKAPETKEVSKPQSKEDIMAATSAQMQKNMKVMMPVMIFFFAAFSPAAVALYWFTNSIVTLVQEHFIKKSLKS